jgi:hypothetical protein
VFVEHGGSGGKCAGPVANQVIHALVQEGYLEGAARAVPGRATVRPTGDGDVEPAGGAG